jgi:hypothetical protein
MHAGVAMLCVLQCGMYWDGSTICIYVLGLHVAVELPLLCCGWRFPCSFRFLRPLSETPTLAASQVLRLGASLISSYISNVEALKRLDSGLDACLSMHLGVNF